VRVVQAAGRRLPYLLIPVGSVCWEAWITSAFMAARSSKIKPLIAAKGLASINGAGWQDDL
jgi:alkanesulfonate monooxygenase